jgi:hypothetical protein
MTGTDKNDCYWTITNTTLFKNAKKLSVEYAVNEKAWMTSDIFQQYVSGTTN